MGDAIERRITQIKMVNEEAKRKHFEKMENLRHRNVMEALKFMAKHKITSFNLELSNRQITRLSKLINK